MDKLSESDDNSGYNSDEINSDIEVELYGAIHHMYGSDGHELAPNSADVVTETEPKATAEDKPIGGQKTCESPLNSSDSNTRLDVSDNEFDKDFVFNDNTEDIDLIEINDSGDDSDVIIIDEKSGDGKRKAKSPDKRRSKASTSGSNRSNRSEPNLSLSLGNVSNLDETAVSAMNQFYDEDDYDSEEEERRMPFEGNVQTYDSCIAFNVDSKTNNELRSCLSASFNKPLDDFHLCHTIATTSSATPHTVTTASTPAHHSLHAFHHQNKHIKWVYPDINDSSDGYGSHTSRATHTSHSSTPIARKCPKNRAISEPIVNTVFNDSSPLTSAFYALDATHTAVTAHTLTHRQINNWQSMQPTSQTTPQLSERAQQRRIRRKMKKLAQKMAQKREHHLLKEANGPQFQTIDSIDKIKKTKQRKKFRRDRNRMKKRQNQSQ
ncbi:unnamed protein product [Oppiella nova]|uniref:Uncharacterized protein n=1 Tax=Oppiella nova TaxID=334625 RepID=A0A7R9QR69_9ACAR|nr:unnamed protein product [Oppiella nova]CAG2172410.1 unnamed protein product [Oppiella nova]